MKFQVTGYSKTNGSKINMEVEASSKADAERKAVHSNVEVVRVAQTSEVDPHNATLPGRPANMSPLASTGASAAGEKRREKSRVQSSGAFRFFLLVILVVVITTAGYFYWDQIKQYIPGMH